MPRNDHCPRSSSSPKTNDPTSRRRTHRCPSATFPKKSAVDGRKSGESSRPSSARRASPSCALSSEDVKKRYEQKAAVEKQKYEARVAEYKKGGGGASSSPAKGGKGASKAASSKKAPAKKGPAKKGGSKAKSSDEDNDDDDDDDEDDEDEE